MVVGIFIGFASENAVVLNGLDDSLLEFKIVGINGCGPHTRLLLVVYRSVIIS